MLVKGPSMMQNADECVIAFPVVGGIFGVARLATKLNELSGRQQIGPWHVGQWIDFKHTAIRIKFLTAGWRSCSAFLRGCVLSNAQKRSCVDAY